MRAARRENPAAFIFWGGYGCFLAGKPGARRLNKKWKYGNIIFKRQLTCAGCPTARFDNTRAKPQEGSGDALYQVHNRRLF